MSATTAKVLTCVTKLITIVQCAASREDDLQQSKSMTSPSFGDSLTAVLQRQVQATREEAQQRTAEEILYLWCLHRLANKGITLSNSLLPEESTPGKQVWCFVFACCSVACSNFHFALQIALLSRRLLLPSTVVFAWLHRAVLHDAAR